MSKLALIAGQGRLPGLLVRHLTALGRPHLVLSLDGFAPDGLPARSFRLENLAGILSDLTARGVTEICFAGAVQRPAVDRTRIDPDSAPLVARIAAAMGQGDDALLRTVASVFEERGLAVVGAHQLWPDLVAPAGALTRATPGPALEADAARARAILDALAPLDLGQAAVVAQGLCLGIETLPGTEALLDFVARTRPGSGGVLAKRPKAGQDLRLDMPAIGPETVDQVLAAGLAGIAVAPGRVLILDRDELLARAEAGGLTVWAG